MTVMSATTAPACPSEYPSRSVTCTTMWTSTAETTSSAVPWPRAMNQKARVASAWRTVKSGSPVTGQAGACGEASRGGSPSGVQP